MKSSPVVGKLMICLILICLFIPQVLVHAEELSTDHWAIQSLIDRGLLELDSEGNFIGTETVDRYTLAITVAKILEEIETGTLKASEDDYQLLKEITNEFRKELTELYASTGKLETDLLHTIKEQVALDNRVNNISKKLFEIEDIASRVEASLMKESEFVRKLQEDLRLSESGQQQILGLGEMQSEKIAKLQKALEDLDIILESQQIEIKRLGNEIADYRAGYSLEIAAVEAEFPELNKAIAEIIALSQQQDENMNQLVSQLEQMQSIAAKTDGELIGFQEQTKIKLAQVDILNEIVRDLETGTRNLAAKIETEIRERSAQTDNLQKELIDLQQKFEFLSTQVGVSEEELSVLAKEIQDRLWVEIGQVNFERGRLASDLKELKLEFDDYKKTTEKELKSARSTAMIGIAAAAIGIVISIINFSN